MFGEPIWKTMERRRRMAMEHAELANATPDEVMVRDQMNLTNGGKEPTSMFSQAAMRLARHAAEEIERKKREQEQAQLNSPEPPEVAMGGDIARARMAGTVADDPYGTAAMALPGVENGAYDESRFRPRDQAQQDSVDPLGYAYNQVSTNLDRPVSAIAGYYSPQTDRPASEWFKPDRKERAQSWMAAVEGFKNPEEMGFGEAAALQALPEGARGPVGGVLDMALDPTNLLPFAPAADIPRVTRGAVQGAERGALAYRDLTRNIPVGASIKDVSGALPDDLAGGGTPSFKDALDGLKNVVRTEARLRNTGVAESEIRAGRAAQFGSVRRSLNQAMESGLSGEELARQARAGASVGGLRRTVAEPLQLSQAQRDALFDEVMTRVADPKEDAGLYLTTTRALQKALDGDGLQPHEIRALQPLLGNDMATALASRAPVEDVAPAVSRARSAVGSGPRIPGQPELPGSLPNVPTPSRFRKSQQLGVDPLAEQHRVSAIKEGLKAAEKQALKEVGPSEEVLMERARKLLQTEKRKLNLPGSPEVDAIKPEVEETIERWIAGNRDILDNMGQEGSQLMANINATITGNVADSWLTAAYSRRNILAESMRLTWGDVADEAAAVQRDKIIARATESLFQRELKLRYPQGVPERTAELMRTTRPIPYNESLGAISTFTQRAKNTMFGPLDVGVFGVQGLNAIRRGGMPLFASMINRTLAAMHMPHIATTYADTMLEKQVQYGLDGVKQGAATGVFQRKQGQKEIGSLFQYLGKPGRIIDQPFMAVADKMSEWQFGTVLGGIRNAAYEGDLVMAHLLGQDITNAAVRRAAANNANAIGSFAETAVRKSRSQKEGVLLLSAPMTRARVAQITQMANVIRPGATPTERIVAATTIVSTVGYTLMVGQLLNDYIGVGDFEVIPGKPGFGRITTAGGRVIDIIPQDSVENAFAKSIAAILEQDPGMAAEAWGNLAIGSAGPAPRIAAGAFGVGYEPGRGYRYGDMGGDLKGRVLNLAPLPPIVSSYVQEGLDPLGTPLETAGITNYPETAYAKASRVYEQETGESWKDATNKQQGAFKEAHPDIAAALEKGFTEQEGPKGDVAQMRVQFREAQDRDDAIMRERGMSWDEWKDNAASRADQLIGASAIAFGNKEIENPENAFEEWINKGRDLRGDDGVMGGEEWEQLDAWVASLSPEDQQRIADETGQGGTALQKERREVANNLDKAGYFDIRDETWKRISQRVDGLSQFKSAEDYRADFTKNIRERLAQRGVTGAEADIIADGIVEELPFLKMWTDISNEIEQGWILTNRKLAASAVEYGFAKTGGLRNIEEIAVMAGSRQ